MLGIARRAVHRLGTKLDKAAVRLTAPPTSTAQAPESGREACLLGIPAEVRNQIFEYVARSTLLHLFPTRSRKLEEPAALLLVCKQIFEEYRYVLLANAEIHAQVLAYNFGHLKAVLERLDEKATDAMGSNPNVCIILTISHVPDSASRRRLYDWCLPSSSKESLLQKDVLFHKRQAQARIPPETPHITFHYDVRFSRSMRPPRPAIRYTNGYEMQLELLRSHIRMVKSLSSLCSGDTAARDESDDIARDLEDCARILEDLSKQRVMEDEYVVTTLAA